jgi:tetratricopeptide (TPR) repeat protein
MRKRGPKPLRSYRGAMSARGRTALAVAAAAALAAVVVAGAAVLTADELPPPAAASAAKPRAGAPPLLLDLGVRDDREALDLRRAADLLRRGRRAEAAAIFRRHGSLEAKVGAAVAAWPGSLDRIEQLGALYPRSSLVQLHVGLARFWAGEGQALEAWREARDVQPNTLYAVRAADFLHPELAPGLPVFVPRDPQPAELAGRSPREQLELLRRGTSLDERLYLGIALQRLGRPLSARRAYAAAAKAAPESVEALVADAVGRYTKEQPEEAFGRLGPLSRRFPAAATVRFHLGLLLLWSGEVKAARTQLRKAERVEPGSPLAREARRYLDRLAAVGTG